MTDWTRDILLESERLRALDRHTDDREPDDWEPCFMYFDEEG